MNFLEGLRRLYLVFSLLIVAICAYGGWHDGRPAFWCGDEVISFAPPVNAAVSAIDSARVKWDDEWTLFEPCAMGIKGLLKRISYAALQSAIAAFVLFLIWKALRWIIIGFWPGAGRRP